MAEPEIHVSSCAERSYLMMLHDFASAIAIQAKETGNRAQIRVRARTLGGLPHAALRTLNSRDATPHGAARQAAEYTRQKGHTGPPDRQVHIANVDLVSAVAWCL